MLKGIKEEQKVSQKICSNEGSKRIIFVASTAKNLLDIKMHHKNIQKGKVGKGAKNKHTKKEMTRLQRPLGDFPRTTGMSLKGSRRKQPSATVVVVSLAFSVTKV